MIKENIQEFNHSLYSMDLTDYRMFLDVSRAYGYGEAHVYAVSKRNLSKDYHKYKFMLFGYNTSDGSLIMNGFCNRNKFERLHKTFTEYGYYRQLIAEVVE